MSKRGRRGIDSTTPTPPTVEFFKIFLPHNLTTHKLRIPPDYVKHFSRTIKERLTLKDGGGKSWHVEVEKTQDGVFITGEWKSFASHHCLTVGDFLCFRYEGCYSFEVKIFGTNGCSKGNFSAKNIETHVKIEKEDNDSPPYTCKKARMNEEVTGLRRKGRANLSRAMVKDKPNEKKPRVYDVDEPELNTCTKGCVDEEEIRLREKGRKELLKDAGVEKYRLNGKNLQEDEIGEREVNTCKKACVDEEEIQLRAKGKTEISKDTAAKEDELNKNINSKSSGNCKGVENGDSAVMKCPYIIQPPSKSPQYRLRIPETISDRRDINFKSEMILRNAHGRDWPVRFYKSDDGGTYLGRGLFEFRKKNIVGFEDSCKFTFNMNSNVIDVQILRSMNVKQEQQSVKKMSGSWQWEAFPIS